MHPRVMVVLALFACNKEPEVVVDPLTTDDDGDGLNENQGDCDDADPAVSPNAIDAPGDGFDADCDTQELCYRDDDKDGFPRTATRPSADLDCDDAGEIGAGVEFDCDDGRAEVHPGAAEVTGDNLDGNCDGGEVCYTDKDNDDYGGGGTTTSTDRDCDDAGEGRHDGDCNDADGSISPGTTEIPDDGIDQNCDNRDACGGTEIPGDGIDGDCDGKELCYVDGDDDGSRSDVTALSSDTDCTDAKEALADAGDDCNDADAAVFEGVGCRPAATCTHVSATTLAGLGHTAWDLAIAADCTVWYPVTTDGTDGAYQVSGSNAPVFYQLPTADQDASSVAIDDANGAVYVGCNSPTELVRVSGSALVSVATGSGTFANPDWSGVLGEEPMSLAVAPTGDVWVPELDAANMLYAVTPTGTVSASGAAWTGHVAAVGNDAAGEAYVAVGTQLLAVSDRGIAHSFPSNVIDFVFDYNDDLYVELAGGEVVYVDHRGSAQVQHAVVAGRGKLAITPDGFLQRVQIEHPSASSFSEWDISSR